MNIVNIVLFLMYTIFRLVFQCLLPLKYIGFGYRLSVNNYKAITILATTKVFQIDLVDSGIIKS